MVTTTSNRGKNIELHAIMIIVSRAGLVFATIVSGILLIVPPKTSGSTEVCDEIKLKVLHRVCGILINELGEPVVGATVTIFEKNAQLAIVHTNGDGRFSFNEMKSGNYELQTKADNYKTFRFAIVVGKPNSRCKRSLEVKLTTGYPENCTGVRLIKR
jgi:hypothetical protein